MMQTYSMTMFESWVCCGCGLPIPAMVEHGKDQGCDNPGVNGGPVILGPVSVAGRLTARKDPPLIDPDKELAAVDIAERNGWLSAGDAERERSRIRQLEILSHLTVQK